MGLEEQVAELSERVQALELEKARYRAERDALSQRVDTLQSGGPLPPAPNPAVNIHPDPDNPHPMHKPDTAV